MCCKERKLTYISGAKPGSDPLQSAGSRVLFYPTSIMPKFLPKILAYFS